MGLFSITLCRYPTVLRCIEIHGFHSYILKRVYPTARNMWIPFFRNMADMPNRPSAKRLQASTSLCKTPDSLWKPFFEPLRVSLSPFHSYVRSLYSGKKSHRRPEWGQNEARRPECCQKAASPASIMGKKPTKAGKYKKIIKKHSKLSWKKATRKYT